jgi:hypothetical protein
MELKHKNTLDLALSLAAQPAANSIGIRAARRRQ